MEKEFLKSSYQRNKVAMKGTFCPVVGIYKPLRIYSRNYCGKRRSIMKSFWKPSSKDRYEFDFVVEVDLEYFSKCATHEDYVMLNEWGLIDKEIVVHSVCSRSSKRVIEFEIRTAKLYNIYLGKMYKMGNMALDALIIKQISNRNEK